ncbi:hypothetical protein [Tabrizicola caldifontis]|uniref:hypothetical protein n=1 Tax=Tabrizicola caldifontis TaxID=2528036 RepID=UPI0010813C5B|nr:hypothetical protein [Rhodobacter sp. YIM 73028]
MDELSGGTAPADTFEKKFEISCPETELALSDDFRFGPVSGRTNYYVDCSAIFYSEFIGGYGKEGIAAGTQGPIRIDIKVTAGSDSSEVNVMIGGRINQAWKGTEFSRNSMSFENDFSRFFSRTTKDPAGGVPPESQYVELEEVFIGAPDSQRYVLRDDTWLVFTIPKMSCYSYLPDNYPDDFSVILRTDFSNDKLHLRSSKGVTGVLVDIYKNGESSRWGQKCQL